MFKRSLSCLVSLVMLFSLISCFEETNIFFDDVTVSAASYGAGYAFAPDGSAASSDGGHMIVNERDCSGMRIFLAPIELIMDKGTSGVVKPETAGLKLERLKYLDYYRKSAFYWLNENSSNRANHGETIYTSIPKGDISVAYRVPDCMRKYTSTFDLLDWCDEETIDKYNNSAPDMWGWSNFGETVTLGGQINGNPFSQLMQFCNNLFTGEGAEKHFRYFIDKYLKHLKDNGQWDSAYPDRYDAKSSGSGTKYFSGNYLLIVEPVATVYNDVYNMVIATGFQDCFRPTADTTKLADSYYGASTGAMKKGVIGQNSLWNAYRSDFGGCEGYNVVMIINGMLAKVFTKFNLPASMGSKEISSQNNLGIAVDLSGDPSSPYWLEGFAIYGGEFSDNPQISYNPTDLSVNMNWQLKVDELKPGTDTTYKLKQHFSILNNPIASKRMVTNRRAEFDEYKKKGVKATLYQTYLDSYCVSPFSSISHENLGDNTKSVLGRERLSLYNYALGDLKLLDKPVRYDMGYYKVSGLYPEYEINIPYNDSNPIYKSMKNMNFLIDFDKYSTSTDVDGVTIDGLKTRLKKYFGNRLKGDDINFGVITPANLHFNLDFKDSGGLLNLKNSVNCASAFQFMLDFVIGDADTFDKLSSGEYSTGTPKISGVGSDYFLSSVSLGYMTPDTSGLAQQGAGYNLFTGRLINDKFLEADDLKFKAHAKVFSVNSSSEFIKNKFGDEYIREVPERVSESGYQLSSKVRWAALDKLLDLSTENSDLFNPSESIDYSDKSIVDSYDINSIGFDTGSSFAIGNQYEVMAVQDSKYIDATDVLYDKKIKSMNLGSGDSSLISWSAGKFDTFNAKDLTIGSSLAPSLILGAASLSFNFSHLCLDSATLRYYNDSVLKGNNAVNVEDNTKNLAYMVFEFSNSSADGLFRYAAYDRTESVGELNRMLASCKKYPEYDFRKVVAGRALGVTSEVWVKDSIVQSAYYTIYRDAEGRVACLNDFGIESYSIYRDAGVCLGCKGRRGMVVAIPAYRSGVNRQYTVGKNSADKASNYQLLVSKLFKGSFTSSPLNISYYDSACLNGSDKHFAVNGVVRYIGKDTETETYQTVNDIARALEPLGLKDVVYGQLEDGGVLLVGAVEDTDAKQFVGYNVFRIYDDYFPLTEPVASDFALEEFELNRVVPNLSTTLFQTTELRNFYEYRDVSELNSPRHEPSAGCEAGSDRAYHTRINPGKNCTHKASISITRTVRYKDNSDTGSGTIGKGFVNADKVGMWADNIAYQHFIDGKTLLFDKENKEPKVFNTKEAGTQGDGSNTAFIVFQHTPNITRSVCAYRNGKAEQYVLSPFNPANVGMQYINSSSSNKGLNWDKTYLEKSCGVLWDKNKNTGVLNSDRTKGTSAYIRNLTATFEWTLPQAYTQTSVPKDDYTVDPDGDCNCDPEGGCSTYYSKNSNYVDYFYTSAISTIIGKRIGDNTVSYDINEVIAKYTAQNKANSTSAAEHISKTGIVQAPAYRQNATNGTGSEASNYNAFKYIKYSALDSKKPLGYYPEVGMIGRRFYVDPRDNVSSGGKGYVSAENLNSEGKIMSEEATLYVLGEFQRFVSPVVVHGITVLDYLQTNANTLLEGNKLPTNILGIFNSDAVAQGTSANQLSKVMQSNALTGGKTLPVIYSGGNANVQVKESGFSIDLSGFALDIIQSSDGAGAGSGSVPSKYLIAPQNLSGSTGVSERSPLDATRTSAYDSCGSSKESSPTTPYKTVVCNDAKLRDIWNSSISGYSSGNTDISKDYYNPLYNYQQWIKEFKDNLTVDMSLVLYPSGSGSSAKKYVGYRAALGKLTGGNIKTVYSYALTFRKGNVVKDSAYKELLKKVIEHNPQLKSMNGYAQEMAAEKLLEESEIFKIITKSLETRVEGANHSSVPKDGKYYGNLYGSTKAKWYDEMTRTFVVKYFEVTPLKLGNIVMSDKLDFAQADSQAQNPDEQRNAFDANKARVGKWYMTVYMKKEISTFKGVPNYTSSKPNNITDSTIISEQHIENADFILADSTTADARR